MSETSKTADTTKKAMDHATKSARDATEAVGRATQEAGHMAQNGADHAKEAVQTITETVAEQSREVMMMGVRTAAGVSGRVADISFGRGHHLLASAAHAMDIYRDASERSAERVQALFSSYMTFGRGLQSMQHALLEIVDQSMEHAAHKPRDLLQCKNIVELAEVQRDLYIDAVNHALESTSRLLELAGRTAQDAGRPLHQHHH